MAACKLCEKETPLRANGICDTCSLEVGIVPLPPSRRPPVPCQRCNEMKFIRCVPREYTVQSNTDRNLPWIAPMTLTQKPSVTPKLLFKGKDVTAPSIFDGFGVLETYVCAKCGFIEWYCQDPESVPIGPEYMTEVVDYSRTTPYRG